MLHEPPFSVTCIKIGAYFGALTYGATYTVLAQDTSPAKAQLRIHDDRGRVRWYPRDCFDLEGRPAVQIAEVRLTDDLDHADTMAITVAVRLTDGAQR